MAIQVRNPLPKYQSSTERPLLIGNLDSDFQNYLTNVVDRSGIISRAVEVSQAELLLKRNPSLGAIVINESWTQSLLRRITFVQRIHANAIDLWRGKPQSLPK